MIEKLKSAGLLIIGFAGIVLVPVLFFKGAIWASEHLLEYLMVAGWLVLFVDVLVLLPLSFVRRIRPYTGGLIYLSSYLFGIVTWLLGFVLTYSIWGGFAVIFGVMFFGVGVVFLAALATTFNAMWSMLAFIIGLLVVTYGSRMVGVAIVNATSETRDVVRV